MLFPILAGLATGILSGFGIGGGSLLMLYLTLIAGMPQQTAAGANLLYFIACAPAALISHFKNKLVCFRALLWCTLAGIPTSIAASMSRCGNRSFPARRPFGILLLYNRFPGNLYQTAPKPNKKTQASKPETLRPDVCVYFYSQALTHQNLTWDIDIFLRQGILHQIINQNAHRQFPLPHCIAVNRTGDQILTQQPAKSPDNPQNKPPSVFRRARFP